MKVNNPAGYIKTVLEKNYPLPQPYIEYIAHKDDEKRRAITLDLVVNCPYCDNNGYRFITVNRDGQDYSAAVRCNHKPPGDIPLFDS